MIIGNWVKVKVDHSEQFSCGHSPRHHQFDGRVGKLEDDWQLLSERKRGRIRRNNPPRCYVCGLPTQTPAELEHFYLVCFDGEHALFSSPELEDMGSTLRFEEEAKEEAGSERELESVKA